MTDTTTVETMTGEVEKFNHIPKYVHLVHGRSDEHNCSCDILPKKNSLRSFNNLLRKAAIHCLENPDTTIDVDKIRIDKIK